MHCVACEVARLHWRRHCVHCVACVVVRPRWRRRCVHCVAYVVVRPRCRHHPVRYVVFADENPQRLRRFLRCVFFVVFLVGFLLPSNRGGVLCGLDRLVHFSARPLRNLVDFVRPVLPDDLVFVYRQVGVRRDLDLQLRTRRILHLHRRRHQSLVLRGRHRQIHRRLERRHLAGRNFQVWSLAQQILQSPVQSSQTSPPKYSFGFVPQVTAPHHRSR